MSASSSQTCGSQQPGSESSGLTCLVLDCSPISIVNRKSVYSK